MNAPEPAPYDTGNALLGGGPASLTTAEVMTPGGKVAAVTMRTSSATVTAFLNKDELQTWGQALLAQANQMTGLFVPAPGSSILQAVE